MLEYSGTHTHTNTHTHNHTHNIYTREYASNISYDIQDIIELNMNDTSQDVVVDCLASILKNIAGIEEECGEVLQKYNDLMDDVLRVCLFLLSVLFLSVLFLSVLFLSVLLLSVLLVVVVVVVGCCCWLLLLVVVVVVGCCWLLTLSLILLLINFYPILSAIFAVIPFLVCGAEGDISVTLGTNTSLRN